MSVWHLHLHAKIKTLRVFKTVKFFFYLPQAARHLPPPFSRAYVHTPLIRVNTHVCSCADCTALCVSYSIEAVISSVSCLWLLLGRYKCESTVNTPGKESQDTIHVLKRFSLSSVLYPISMINRSL